MRLPRPLAVLLLALFCGPASATEPLPHQVYIWQRQWSAPVHEAISNTAPALAGFVVLAAEFNRQGLVRVSPAYAALQATAKPYGLALRVGPGATASPELAASLLASNSARELQIDFDCAETGLADYQRWLSAIRVRIAPTPLTITALPAWLRQPAFSNLVAATDGFVLQVHSLGTTLCDTAAAVRAVAQASRFGIPFQVALPTYGYLMAHDRQGKFLGLTAEGSPPRWPADALHSEVRADPAALAALVRLWNTERPPNLRGIIWYRLPVATDQRNWRWPTLAAIIAGQTPAPLLRINLRQPHPGLIELDLHNDGTADALVPTAIHLRWATGTLLACDALAGFVISGTESNRARFVGNPRLAPGEHRVAGWLRFAESKEVTCEIELGSP